MPLEKGWNGFKVEKYVLVSGEGLEIEIWKSRNFRIFFSRDLVKIVVLRFSNAVYAF